MKKKRYSQKGIKDINKSVKKWFSKEMNEISHLNRLKSELEPTSLEVLKRKSYSILYVNKDLLIYHIRKNQEKGKCKMCGCILYGIFESLKSIIKFYFELFLNHLITGNMYYILIQEKLLGEESRRFYDEFEKKFNYILIEDDMPSSSVSNKRNTNIANPFIFIKPADFSNEINLLSIISLGLNRGNGESILRCLTAEPFGNVINWLKDNNKLNLKDKLLDAIVNDCKENWRTDNTEEENLKNKFIEIVKSYTGV